MCNQFLISAAIAKNVLKCFKGFVQDIDQGGGGYSMYQSLVWPHPLYSLILCRGKGREVTLTRVIA